MSKWAVALAWVPTGRLAWLFIYAYNSAATSILDHWTFPVGYSALRFCANWFVSGY